MSDTSSRKSGAPSKVVFTVGHSNRSGDDFVGLVRSHGVQEVIDVRRFPGSRRNPQFDKLVLAEQLASAGITYEHSPELGGRRGRPDPNSPNNGWRVSGFRAYADRMAEAEWIAALDALEERCRLKTVAYMCAEAVPWRCHRRLISDALTVRGLEVRHILARNRADLHQLPDFARVISRDRIIYPAPEAVD